MSSGLDRIDLKMLRLLQNSGRLTNAELAETVGVSAATCHRRTQRLFDEGYIAACGRWWRRARSAREPWSWSA
jgi:Lrp/AsnC family leucine-responsive transcriptional regulator